VKIDVEPGHSGQAGKAVGEHPSSGACDEHRLRARLTWHVPCDEPMCDEPVHCFRETRQRRPADAAMVSAVDEVVGVPFVRLVTVLKDEEPKSVDRQLLDLLIGEMCEL
jgi:hypothetical protein